MTEDQWFIANKNRIPYMNIDAIVHEVWTAAQANRDEPVDQEIHIAMVEAVCRTGLDAPRWGWLKAYTKALLRVKA